MPKKAPVNSEKSVVLQFRASEELHSFFKSASKRVKGVRNMRHYLLHLAMKDGYQPTAQDL